MTAASSEATWDTLSKIGAPEWSSNGNGNEVVESWCCTGPLWPTPTAIQVHCALRMPSSHVGSGLLV